jgi:pyruvate/2-oxoglutarate dehydrogenase complex dihydrolipoamide dehydrogenase (E3) component
MNPQIHAAGNICLLWQFTHAADAAARIVIKNTLFVSLTFENIKRVFLSSKLVAHIGQSKEIQPFSVYCYARFVAKIWS